MSVRKTEIKKDIRRQDKARTHSSGIVVYTVTRPAIAPMVNVILVGIGCPGRAFPCTNCFSVVYVVNRTAELAP